jgi:hypothetical protein
LQNGFLANNLLCSQRSEMERLKEDEPDISHKERYLFTFVSAYWSVHGSNRPLGLSWPRRTGNPRRKIPRPRNVPHLSTFSICPSMLHAINPDSAILEAFLPASVWFHTAI